MAPRPRLSGWRAAIVPPPGAARLSGAALADAVGTGLFMSGAVVFFTNRLGLSTVTIGTGLAVAGAVALLVITPLGMVTDRVGYARSIRATHFLRAAIYPLYLFTDGAAGFVVVVTLLTIADRLAAPVFQAVVGTAVGDERRSETMGYIRALRNAGFSLGGLLTSAAVAVATPVAYDTLVVGNAVSFALAGTLLLRVPNVRAPRSPRDGPRLLRIQPRYLGLAALNVVMLLHDTILQLALPLYVIKQTDVPVLVLPLMFVLNTVLVVLLQRRLSRRAATMAGAARAVRTAGCYLAASCAGLGVASILPPVPAVVALAVGVVLLTVGESLQISGAWELSHSHAPAADRGAYLAIFSIGGGVQRSIGPPVVSLFTVWGAVTWLPLAVAFLLAGVATRRLAARPWSRPRHPVVASTSGEPA